MHFSELERVKICILANFSYSNTLYIKYFSYICTIKQNQGRKSNAKAYIIDPGLQNNRDNSFAGENIGWRLENVVYIELLRRWTFGIEFDDETLTLKIANAQAIGSYLNTYYVYSSFLGADGYPYVDTSIYGNFKFDVMEDEDGTIAYAPLSGKISSIDIIGISFLLYTSNEATTSPVGQVNYLTNVTLLKMDADDMAGAKAYIQAKQYIMR